MNQAFVCVCGGGGGGGGVLISCFLFLKARKFGQEREVLLSPLPSPLMLNTERSYKTRLNGSDCQSKIQNARIGLVDYQKSYFSTFKFPQ